MTRSGINIVEARLKFSDEAPTASEVKVYEAVQGLIDKAYRQGYEDGQSAADRQEITVWAHVRRWALSRLAARRVWLKEE